MTARVAAPRTRLPARPASRRKVPTLQSVLAIIRLGRPMFLGGGFIIYALGSAIAARAGHVIDLHRYLLGQAAVTSFQLMTHYANEYFDYEADRANTTPTRWSGGSRVLVGDLLPRRVALHAALVLLALGLGCSAWLLVEAGAEAPLRAFTLAAILALAWGYSAPPLRLCAAGLGEVATAAVVTVLVPFLAFQLQAPGLAGLDLLGLSLPPLALLQIAMLLAIEFPDAAGDAATGKRTLVVRLGAARAAQLYVAITAAAFAWLPLAHALGLPGAVALAAALPVPLAIWRIARISEHRDPAAYERLTFFAVFLLVVTGTAELIAYLR